MVKAFEKAKFVAEASTRQRRLAPALHKIESKLTRNILAQSLALEIIRNLQKPTSELVSELMEIEIRVGKFVGEALKQVEGEPQKAIDLRGTLAGALSFIPIKPVRSQSPLKGDLFKLVLGALQGILLEKDYSQPQEGTHKQTQQGAETKALPKVVFKKAKCKKTIVRKK